MGNIFEKLVSDEFDAAKRLGCPSENEGDFLRRRAFFASLNPQGFRQYPKGPKLNKNGETRGDVRKKLRARALENIRLERSSAPKLEFMHSHARRDWTGLVYGM